MKSSVLKICLVYASMMLVLALPIIGYMKVTNYYACNQLMSDGAETMYGTLLFRVYAMAGMNIIVSISLVVYVAKTKIERNVIRVMNVYLHIITVCIISSLMNTMPQMTQGMITTASYKTLFIISWWNILIISLMVTVVSIGYALLIINGERQKYRRC